LNENENMRKAKRSYAAMWTKLNEEYLQMSRVSIQVLPLIVMPSSTPLFFCSFTWKVPLLGTTDSGHTAKSI